MIDVPEIVRRRKEAAPQFCDRKTASRLLTEIYGFPISPRTLERWPLPLRRVNGRALATTAVLFDIAERMLADALEIASPAAPERHRAVVKGGRR